MIRTAQALLASAILILLASASAADEGRISAPEALERLASGHLTVSDVRSPREWRQSGVPLGAKAITMHDPQGMERFYENVLAAVGGDKSRPVATICARGKRSHYTRTFLEARGFSQVFDISEGMLGRGGQPGWLKRGLPTAACDNC